MAPHGTRIVHYCPTLYLQLEKMLQSRDVPDLLAEHGPWAGSLGKLSQGNQIPRVGSLGVERTRHCKTIFKCNVHNPRKT
eukprot:238136-Amphidinium_carterae.1